MIRIKALVTRCMVAVILMGATGRAHAQEPAQPVPGRSGMSTADALTNVDAFTDLAHFGRCFASMNRQAVFGVLATTPGSTAETEMFRRVLANDEQQCLHGGTRTQASNAYFRGVFAEGLLTNRTPLPPNLIQTPIPVDQVSDLGGIGRCYIGAHRAEAQALLATRLGSAEEMAAVRILWPSFNACIPRRFSIRLNAPWIRMLIAEAVLRVPARAAPTSGN